MLYYRNILGLVNETNSIQPLTKLAYEVNWCAFYKDIVILSEKPEIIIVNAKNKLHCTNGPAIRYKDGFETYALNGKRITDETEIRNIQFNAELEQIILYGI
jgi:hypothetical protein